MYYFKNVYLPTTDDGSSPRDCNAKLNRDNNDTVNDDDRHVDDKSNNGNCDDFHEKKLNEINNDDVKINEKEQSSNVNNDDNDKNLVGDNT